MPKVVGFWRAPGILLAQLAEPLGAAVPQRVLGECVHGEFSAALIGREDEPPLPDAQAGQLSLLVAGELLEIAGHAGMPAREAFAKAYADDPSCAFLARAAGVFSGVLFDEVRQRLVLFSDPLGLSHLYYTFDAGHGLLFASEQKRLVRARALDLDPHAPEEFLRHGHLVGDSVWLSQVRLVKAGECVQLDLRTGALTTHFYFDLDRVGRQPFACYEEAKRSIKEAYIAAFARSTRGLTRVRVPLSGDLTSRLLLAQATDSGLEARALTVAEYDSEDALFAQQAASIRSTRQVTARPHMGAWLSARARLGFLAEGVELGQLRYAPLVGAMAGGHVLEPTLSGLLLGTRAIRGFDDLRRQNVLRHARRAFAATRVFDHFAPQRFPFADLTLFTEALRAEVPYLLRDRLYLELASELHPEYFRSIPIAHSDGRTAAQLLSGVAAPAPKVQANGLPAPDVHGYLRSDAAAERFLWELLSDPRALYRSYVDAKEAHAAFWSFFKGSDATTLAPLMRYVSLEIWLRQLMRGELVDGLPLGNDERERAPRTSVVPDVSVIVPAYNVEAYLGECLNSLCNQELPNIEILVVDDGSSDGTPAIIERFAREDARIRTVRTPNSGVYHARNRALELAKGRYISFVDSDDYVHPTMLRSLLEAAERHRAEVAFCDVYQFDADRRMKVRNNTLRFKPNTPLSLATTPEMIGDGFTTLWNRIYERRFLQKHQLRFDERFRISADMLFLQELLAKANTVVRVAGPLYFYRFATPKSLTSYEVRNAQYLTHLAITIELIDFWLRQKLFTRFAPFVLLKAMRNFLWNTHIDEAKLEEVFAKFHAYVKGLSVGPVAIGKIPLFERRAFQLLRSGDYRAFRRHIRRYRAKMIAAKGGELSPIERVASEMDALRSRFASVKPKLKKEPAKKRVRVLWPAAQVGVVLAHGDGFQLRPEDLLAPEAEDSIRERRRSPLELAKNRIVLEGDIAGALRQRKPGAKQRVLHFSNAFSVPSETFTYDVITGLEENEDVDNYVMCFDRQLARERPYEKTIVLRGSLRDELEAFEPRAMAKIEQVLARIAPDLVHCHFGWVGIPLARWLARSGRTLPLVITMHGTDVNMWPARHAWYSDALKSMGDKPWLSFTTHTEVYRDKLVRLGVRASQIEVIPNSFDPKFARTRARHPFQPGDHLRVISVARMDIWKGHEHLIRGFSRFVQERYSNASLTLVGYGPEEVKLRKLVAELGVEEQVRFYGRAQHYEVPVLLRNHDVYVQPSIKHPETLQEEGQPIAVLEAIASGIPVIVTDTGGMGETVRVGDYRGSAWIIPDKDAAAIAEALLSVVGHSPDAAAQGAYVESIVRKHARSGQLARTLAVYARALTPGQRVDAERPRADARLAADAAVDRTALERSG